MKEIDWVENDRCIRVSLLCCTCCACDSFNRLEKKDPIFGEDIIEFYCTRHDKKVDQYDDPCDDFH